MYLVDMVRSVTYACRFTYVDLHSHISTQIDIPIYEHACAFEAEEVSHDNIEQ